MNIAFLTPINLTTAGGVETHILQLARALRHLGLHVDIFAQPTTPNDSPDPVLPFSRFRPPRYHILHTHAGLLSPRLLSLSLTRSPRQRHVHTLHGLSLDYLFACRDWLNWRCYTGTLIEAAWSRYADHVIAVSRSARAQARRYFRLPAPKISVIPNGFAPCSLPPNARDDFRQKLHLTPHHLALLFVGRGEDQVKGAAAVTAALHHLHARFPHLRLIAVPGAGFSPAPWLCPTGTVPYSQIPLCYAAADIFVNASLSEGLPLTLVEALAAPLPIVAAPVGGIPDLITHNRTGLLTNPQRSDLSAQLERLIRNPFLRRTLAQNALRAAQPLTWSHIARQTADLYLSLIK